jgi:AraC-like DNA-binding protein
VKEIWDSSLYRPGDREEALRDLLWRSVVRIEVDHHVAPDQINTQMTLGNLGSLGVLSILSTGATVRRTQKLVKDDKEAVMFLGLQISGTSVVIQDGRQAFLHAGEFVLYDTTSPYTLLFDGGIDKHFLRIPRAELALPDAVIRAATAVTFGAGHPVAGLAATYLAHLLENHELREGRFAESVAQPTVELIRAVISIRTSDAGISAEPLYTSLPVRIMEYLREHLADADLSADTIARAHNISVRHLYATLAKSDISLGDWIRAHRLEECRRALGRPASHGTTITALAAQWGFADGAHFSRLFKEAYGLSPREWRTLKGSGL